MSWQSSSATLSLPCREAGSGINNFCFLLQRYTVADNGSEMIFSELDTLLFFYILFSELSLNSLVLPVLVKKLGNSVHLLGIAVGQFLVREQILPNQLAQIVGICGYDMVEIGI